MPKYVDDAGLARFWDNIKSQIGGASDEQIAAWMEAHPEATTTVQDSSITTAKLADGAVTDAKLAQAGGVLDVTAAHADLASRNMIANETFVQGSVEQYTGEELTSNKRIRCGYVPLEGLESFTIGVESGYKYVVDWFDATKTIMKDHLVHGTWQTVQRTFYKPNFEDAAYVRFLVSTSNNATIQPSASINLNVTCMDELTTFGELAAGEYVIRGQSLNWVLGSIVNGLPSSSTARIRSEKILVKKGAIVAVNWGTGSLPKKWALVHMYDAVTDEYLGQIGSTWDNSHVTVPYDCAISILVRNDSGSTITASDIPAYSAAVTVYRKPLTEVGSIVRHDNQAIVIDGIRADLANLKQRVVALENTELPAYYESGAYSISGRCADILALNPKRKEAVVQFVFLTDHHANSNGQQFRSKPLMDYIFDNTLCDMFVNGGDVVNGLTGSSRQTSLQYTKQVRQYWNALIPDACELSLMVAGNHDGGAAWNPNTGCLIDQDTLFREAPFRRLAGNVVFDPNGKFQYYVDDGYHKVRWLVCNWANGVNIGDWDESKTFLVDGENPTNMYAFIASALQSLEDGWTVVLFNHIILQSSDMADQITAIETLCDAYKNRSTVTAYSLTYDFSGAGGSIAAIIGGHSHFDHFFSTSGGIPVILTTTDNCTQQYVPDFANNTASMDSTIRQSGTTDEQAFDVFTIDTENKTIVTTRIGYGTDRNWTY